MYMAITFCLATGDRQKLNAAPPSLQKNTLVISLFVFVFICSAYSSFIGGLSHKKRDHLLPLESCCLPIFSVLGLQECLIISMSCRLVVNLLVKYTWVIMTWWLHFVNQWPLLQKRYTVRLISEFECWAKFSLKKDCGCLFGGFYLLHDLPPQPKPTPQFKLDCTQ